MEAYWKTLYGSIGDLEDIDSYVKEWGDAKFTKALLYGQVASIIIGCLPLYGREITDIQLTRRC